MNRSKHLIAITTALIALAGAGSALAIEATQDFPAAQTAPAQSRDDVKRELIASQRDRSASPTEASPAPEPMSTPERRQSIARNAR